MATLEDILNAYAEAGVDPTMADLGRIYSESSQLGLEGNTFYGGRGGRNMRPYIPQTPPINSAPPIGAAPPMMGSDMSFQVAATSAASLDRVSKEVANLANSVSQVLMRLEQEGSRTNMSIQSLADLQRQAQQNITRQQVSLTQAQLADPSSFALAPGVAYQTSAEMAVFRNRMIGQQTRFADRPQPSFLSDLMVGTPFGRSFYEPTYVEDPMMSALNAARRNEERFNSLGRGAIEFGGQMATGSAAFAGVAAGGSALAARFGMAALGGPIGMGVAGLDTILGIAGLPSISGAVSSATGAVMDATVGRYFVNKDMARDIQSMTQFFTGPGSSPTGRGLGRGAAGRVVTGLREMSASDIVLNQEDYMNIFRESAQQGLLSQSGDEQQMLQSIRKISKNLRLFMRLTGDPDYRNAIKQMGDLFRMGVGQDQLAGAAQNVQNFSRMAGISTQQAQAFGQQGALIAQQAGGNMGVGYQMGIQNRALARMTAQSGAFSPGVLAAMGGEEGLAQTLTETMGAFMGGPMNKLMLGGVLTKDAKGNVVIDEEMMKRVDKGDFSFRELQNRANSFLGNQGNYRKFMMNEMELQNQLSTRQGPMGIANFMLGTIKAIQNESGGDLSYQEAATVMFRDSNRARKFVQVFNSQNMRRFEEAEKKQVFIQRMNQNIVDNTQNQFTNSFIRTAGSLYNDLTRGIDKWSERAAAQEEYEESVKAGFLNELSPEAKFMQKMDKKYLGAFSTEKQKSEQVLDYEDVIKQGAMFISDPSKAPKKKVDEVAGVLGIGGKVSSFDLKKYANKYTGMLGDVDEEDLVQMREDFDAQYAGNPQYEDLDLSVKNALFSKHVRSISDSAKASNLPEIQLFGSNLSGQSALVAQKGVTALKEQTKAARLSSGREEQDALELYKRSIGVAKDVKFTGLFEGMGEKDQLSLVQNLARLGTGSLAYGTGGRDVVEGIKGTIAGLSKDRLSQISSDLGISEKDLLGAQGPEMLAAAVMDSMGAGRGFKSDLRNLFKGNTQKTLQNYFGSMAVQAQAEKQLGDAYFEEATGGFTSQASKVAKTLEKIEGVGTKETKAEMIKEKGINQNFQKKNIELLEKMVDHLAVIAGVEDASKSGPSLLDAAKSIFGFTEKEATVKGSN